MATASTLSEAKRTLLQSYLSARGVQSKVMMPRITRRAPGTLASLTTSQEQLLLREFARPDAPPLYNECIRVQIPGTLDFAALKKSLLEIVERHEIWRTSYRGDNGRIRQLIHSTDEQIDIPMLDFRGLSPQQQEDEIIRQVGTLVQTPFKLDCGPLLRACCIKLSEVEHWLYLVAHLSIVDGLSVYRIFPSELAALYCAHVSGRSADLPSLPIQFSDYANWQSDQMETDYFSSQLDYWNTQLASGPIPLSWPADRQRPAQETFRGEIETFPVPLAVAQAMKTLARTEGVTLFMVLLSVLAALLHLYTGQDDFTIGTPAPSGRKHSDVETLLGYFLTPVALRFRFKRSMTFRELLREAQRLTVEAISNDDLPVEVLTQKLNIPLDPSRNPLFTVAASLQPTMPKLDLDWTVTSMDISSGGAPWDLYLAFIDGRREMLGRVQYNPDLFEFETIARFTQDYLGVADIISVNPEVHLSRMTLSLT